MENNYKEINMPKLLDEKSNALVKIRDLDVFFGGRKGIHAIKSMNLNIYKGEILGLIGESGSGKSTTGNSIIGLVDKQEGTININGKEVPKRVKEIKGDIYKHITHNVQMIFQDPTTSLNPYKTIYKAVTEGLNSVDIDNHFVRIFDSETLEGIKKIVGDGRVRIPELTKITHLWFNKCVKNKEYSELRQSLYVDVIEAMKDRRLEKFSLIRRFTSIRLRQRDTYFGRKDNVINKKAINYLTTEFMEMIGISRNQFRRYPLEFSGGQQQRVGIARALLLRPKLLIADEPISALDVSIQAQVVNILKELRDELGLTILFIAHDLNMIQYISDRVCVMYKGQIVEIGRPDDISNNSLHPYTRQLIAAMPTINNKKGSIKTQSYDYSQHGYRDADEPEWFLIGDDHYVLGTEKEIKKWMQK